MRISGMPSFGGSIYSQTRNNAAVKGSTTGDRTDPVYQRVHQGKTEQPKDSFQKSKVSNAEAPKKVENNTSLPDHLFEYAQKQAAEDARNGVYMSKKYVDSTLSYMRKNISPNRAKLMSMYNPIVMNARYTGKGPSYFSVPGFSGFTARFSVGRVFGAYMSIWNGSGEQVLSYSPPPNAGWHEHQTKAESNFIDEVDAVYTQVYDEVRKQMKTEAAGGTSTASNFNVQA